jgi:hypothetical protein
MLLLVSEAVGGDDRGAEPVNANPIRISPEVVALPITERGEPKYLSPMVQGAARAGC